MTDQADIAAYRAARNALENHMDAGVKQHGRHNVPETDETDRLQRAVVDAEKNVPWWRR
jgi:hypothetical protein